LRGRYGRGKRIAVLFLEGAVCDGESRRHPLFGTCFGDRTSSREIRKLADDKKVKAVVLRVNSPGGSAIASETIRGELAYLREKKPVVVSMANVAGSGGYWISTEAERVFADALTLTGSIGVLMLLLEVETVLRKHGVTTDAVETARLAGIGSPLRKMTREEHHLLETRVEQVYEDFLRRVATARSRTPEDTESVAGGRVWSGRDAVEVGLADELGGLPDAIEYLRRSLGKKRVSVHVYPEVKTSLLQRIIYKNLKGTAAGAGPWTSGGAGPFAGAAAEAGALPGWAAFQATGGAAAAGISAARALHGVPLAVVPELVFGETKVQPYSTSQGFELSM
jgi:protease-4